MTFDLKPQVEARLFDFARQEGIDPADLVEKWVTSYRPNAPVYTAANDPLMAQLADMIAQAPTDPVAVEEAESELREFMRNMNATRKEAGARLLYPEAQ